MMEDEENNLLRRLWLWFLDFIETIVIALAIFVVVYRFLFQPHQVKGSSMYDNFHDGEYLLTDKVTYRFRSPERGDVVVFKAPQNEDYDYIKRIIALPGDTVKISGGQVFVNNTLINESGFLDARITTHAGLYAKEGQNVTIPAAEYFVMGDNRNNSSDSREWGPVPAANLVGRTWLRYWPVNLLGVIDKYPKN
ncbi:signal peptidase I [Candidatus Beckwithbacteria bacterium CG22_combo_CG10-13_8_21_14_all_01_47_9]|uniref:Signal peptidase I n=5 Tax=Candidatus Beckwithiibacteriota TaxID=1752726 RepID=A0A2H0E1B9_9BACT|nr:MAG: signal peptidase I [Candidatus Beckwithbacteria bacterium CG23_combo_of_CG06-09_8_20_14_all_47_9]PIP88232.1 MAG: signal peptidase I [Candidatus Beckwithbacteria bacterium CG22_combo_CG10-13_8_21_14_all_01_47_9]PJA22620.1 MAG: signal peptidase I [Candidatus Beckwithbacteria bacterium CG_4_10_14_0_2_um_filter_47_25]PJC66143.1 MAG: signal peptidase I [Candidatus Beckwithbacteria bacterium CG_4_9_14_0_2_um_filter_47_11]